MTTAGQRLLAAAREALAIAAGRSSPVRFTDLTTKGRKVVAKDFHHEYRQVIDEWYRPLFIERRTVFWNLHPTKGWRRVGSTAWMRWEAGQ